MTITESAFVPALVAPDFNSFAVRQTIAGFLAGHDPGGLQPARVLLVGGRSALKRRC